MKRILVGGMLAASLILLQPSPAPLAEEKAAQGWTTDKDGIKVLRLWQMPNLGPRWPEIALMQLTDRQQAELQENPLQFLRKHHIFDTDLVIGQFSVRLMDPRDKAKDATITVAAHGSATYSGVASFQVDEIVDLKN